MMGYIVLPERENQVGDLRGLGVLDPCVLFNCLYIYIYIHPNFLPLIFFKQRFYCQETQHGEF